MGPNRHQSETALRSIFTDDRRMSQEKMLYMIFILYTVISLTIIQ